MKSCPACGNEVSSLAKFCSECGAALAPPTGAAPSAEAAEGELRQLTALFCDLVGSTELSTRMDAEEFGELIHRYLSCAAAVVRRYEGEVARYLGDGILAHFGWPEAHDDDAERAVRAALDIIAEMHVMNRELPSDRQLAMRAGIHTGPAMIGEIRGSAQPDTISLGETLNIAARLQIVAPRDGVVISGATRDLVRGIFVMEELPPQVLKGIPEPVPVYRAIQPTGVRSRLDAAHSLTPLADCDEEIASLMEAWRRARDGAGQTTLVVGEAGVGKSRLVYELRRRLREEPHSWLECRCSSYTRQSAFRPAAELIEQGLQLRATDRPDEKLAKLERGLALAGVESADAVDLLAPLLSIPVEDRPSGTSAELRRRRTIELVGGWVMALARPQPMVLFVDDLQWSDPSSLDLLGELMSLSETAPLLIVATARPEFTPPWQERSNLTVVPVSPLERGDAREMVLSLGGRRDVPAPILDRIVSQTDGIPLYIEEIGRMVLESVEAGGQEESSLSSASASMDIPTTLQGSLMARLDRLSAAKRVAQRGAVIGREFSFELLEEVAGVEDAELREGLERLVEDQLLFKSGELPNATFTFKHALIQDAAYQSVLRRTRTALHGRIAEALERRPHADPAATPEVVARHFEAAGRIESAATHYGRAAEQAAKSSGHREAIGHLHKAIELLGRLPRDRPRDETEIDMQIELASSIMAIRSYADPDVREAYQRAQELCEALGDGARVGYALAGLSIFYSNGAELSRGEELARRVLDIGEREDDDALRLLARVQLAVPTCYQGRFAESLAHCREALEIYDPERHRSIAFRFGTDHGVAAHGFAGLSLCFLGDTERALDHVRRGLDLARSLGSPFNVAYALLSQTIMHWMRGEAREQGAVATELVAISEEQGFDLFTGIGRMCRAASRAMIDRDPAAIGEMIEGGTIAARTGTRGAVPALMAMVAEAQRAVGDQAAALATVEGARAIVAETGERAWESRLLWLQGELALDGPASSSDGSAVQEAEALLRDAMQAARNRSARMDELRAAASLARLFLLRGDADQAAALLHPVCDGFTEDCSLPALAEARAMLLNLPSTA